MQKRWFGRGFAGLLGLSLALALTPALAQAQERISSDVKVAVGGKLTFREKQAISLAAGRILIHVNHARTDIRHKRDKEALRHVEKALTLTKIIENAVPEYRIASTIKSGNLSYQETETVKPLIVPVYPELDETASVLIPVKRTKKEAAAASDTSSGQGDGQLQYTTVSLDVEEAQHCLNEAQAALQRIELPTADKALASIQEDVVFDFDEIDLPLAKARWHLLDAARKVSRKEYAEAKEALHKAAGAVETYMSQTGEGLSAKARGLADEINHLAIKLDEKKDKATDAIHLFWGRLVDLM
jgi:hypothetical protein